MKIARKDSLYMICLIDLVIIITGLCNWNIRVLNGVTGLAVIIFVLAVGVIMEEKRSHKQ